MNLQQMRYFLTVAETGNITAAANLLHMAQPPLSRQIKQLEEELDTELFDRSGRHLQLTESGILLAHRVREILNLTERSLQEVRSVGQGISGTLYMGAVSTANYMLLPNLIKEFNKLYPQVRFQLVTEATTRITELLEKGVLELGIVRMPFNSNFFDSYNLPEEKLVAILNNESHPLPQEKKHSVRQRTGNLPFTAASEIRKPGYQRFPQAPLPTKIFLPQQRYYPAAGLDGGRPGGSHRTAVGSSMRNPSQTGCLRNRRPRAYHYGGIGLVQKTPPVCRCCCLHQFLY